MHTWSVSRIPCCQLGAQSSDSDGLRRMQQPSGAMACIPADARIPLSAALDGDQLACILASRGYAVLSQLGDEECTTLRRCESRMEELCAASASVKKGVRVGRSGRRTRLHARCASLPLAGLGYQSILDSGREQREQLHILCDEHAVRLMPWPEVKVRGLKTDMLAAAALLHHTCTRLLGQLGAGEVERRRSDQAARLGDLSVLDVFRYPNADAAVSNMRTHTDPGF